MLANCTVGRDSDESQHSEAEYAEVGEMGLWHSTPLPHRHKSKISLTWVLKDGIESTKLKHDSVSKSAGYLSKNCTQTTDGQLVAYKAHVNRVVGRNEHYHNLRLRGASETLPRESCSDTSGTDEYARKKHRHRHRRKKRREPRFGYDIRDLDSFLSAVSFFLLWLCLGVVSGCMSWEKLTWSE